MKKKYVLLGLLILIIGSFIVIQTIQDKQDVVPSVQPAMPTASSSPAMPAANDTTPSAMNVSHNIKMEIKTLQTYVSSHPSDTTHVIRLARLYQDSHEPAKAAGLYEQYLKSNKNSGIQPWLDLTNCYGESNKWDKALETTKRTLKRFPGNPSTLYNQGAIYANMGKYNEARQSWNKVLQTKASSQVMHLAKESLKKLEQTSK